MTENQHTRREFLEKITKLGTSLVVTGIVGSGTTSCGSDPTSPNDSNNDQTLALDLTSKEFTALNTVGNTLALAANQINNFDSKGIFVIRTSQTEVRVLSRNCTHQNCIVSAFIGGNANCACHNSNFDLNGNVVSGQANSRLKSYSATLSGNTITISS